MSIKERWEKIKGGYPACVRAWRPEALLERNLFIALLLAGTALASFALGLLAGREDKRLPVRVTFSDAAASSSLAAPALPVAPDNAKAKRKYVGSKGGNKYHLPWCSGAKRIREENKIWFASKEEAGKAGYAPAGNCKGI